MALAGRADRVFDGLLRLFPQEFRDRHGREIVQVFRAERADAATRRERAVVWVATAIGLLRTAPAEHLSILRQDARHAARSLARNPVFTTAALLTLAIPIGAATASLGLLNSVVFEPLAFANVERVVLVDEIGTGPGGDERRLRVTGRSFDAIRGRDDLFEAIAAHRRRTFTFLGREGAELVPAAMVSSGWSRLLPALPVAGRLFTEREETSGAGSRVAIVSRRLWSAHVRPPKKVPGATLTLDGETYRVVGILPDSFRYPYNAEIWIPGTFAREQKDLLVAARVRKGVSLDALNRELSGTAARLAEVEPAVDRGTSLEAAEIRPRILEGAERTAWLLLGAVGALLAIACGNVVHLLFVRVAARQREFCIRGALGANRARQVRQLVTETIVLFAIAAGLGLVAAPLVSHSFLSFVPQVLRSQLGITSVAIDGTVVLVVSLATLGLSVVFGLIAAAQAPPVNLTAMLNDDVPSSAGRRARRMTRAAIVSQVALALVLVACAGFLVQTYERMRRRDPGFDTRQILTFQVDLPAAAYPRPEERVAAIDQSLQRIQQLPGVVSAAASSVNPLCCYEWGAEVAAEGQPGGSETSRFVVHHREVTPEFFNVMGIRLKRGRPFTDRDAATAEPVAIVDARMVERFWPGRDVIGRRIRIVHDDREHPWRTIVGVAETVQDNGAFDATWYVPLNQSPDHASVARMHLMIKTTVDPLSLTPAVRGALAGVKPPMAPFQITTMEALRTQSLSRERLSAFVLIAFAVFGLLLASIGIYGVTANAIERRLPEFGIRMAFGAGPAAILRAAAGRALQLSAAGCAIGISAAFVVGFILERAIFSTTTADPRAIASAALLVSAASLLACGLPAWRAAGTVPRAALRRWE